MTAKRNGKTHAAYATLEQMGYTFEGGQLWKPTLGKAPDFPRIDADCDRLDWLDQMAGAALVGMTEAGGFSLLQFHPGNCSGVRELIDTFRAEGVGTVNKYMGAGVVAALQEQAALKGQS